MTNKMSLRSVLRSIKLKGTIPVVANECSLLMRHYLQKNHKLSITRSAICQYSTNNRRTCWKCNFPYKSELFCSKCETIQKPPEDLNYFELFGIEEDYDIVNEEVQKTYRLMQTMLHPDRFGNKSDKEKSISENFSSLLNTAYTTLMHPLHRGLYILKLKNASIPESTTNLDAEFLMTIMEKNEEVEQASKDEVKLIKLIKENRDKLNSLTLEISKAFRQRNILNAKELLTEMKYYTTINERLKKLKDELGIIE